MAQTQVGRKVMVTMRDLKRGHNKTLIKSRIDVGFTAHSQCAHIQHSAQVVLTSSSSNFRLLGLTTVSVAVSLVTCRRDAQSWELLLLSIYTM